MTGRKKEIIVTTGGKKTAPANIEAMLKSIDPIGNAVVIGDNRNYLVALVTVDDEKVEAFGKAHGWPQKAGALAELPEFRAYLWDRVQADVNPRLSRFEMLKKVDVLPNEFSVEGGEPHVDAEGSSEDRRREVPRAHQRALRGVPKRRRSRVLGVALSGSDAAPRTGLVISPTMTARNLEASPRREAPEVDRCETEGEREGAAEVGPSAEESARRRVHRHQLLARRALERHARVVAARPAAP